ncbi:hypothetical protein E4P40_25480 [Blastococcus sp. CT_GayMR20]|uniref:hypothetical protein n=1 Tax=Blastococcus sp. CT_GayMR20 TaxID=2559609 RepID=UPI001073074D|nr:hypothetical protein [Blastococcus sp. CT_GayMR20]TFV66312.1 hypothetical protein E4P40_25480 [Blastococcus sp. CT_GayMR20]
MPGGRLTGLQCALVGHRWTSQPTLSGTVMVLCERCAEMVSAGFVDQARVLGLADVAGRSFLGATSSSRLAVDLAAAVAARDGEARRRLREEATARPGQAVDSLAHLAAVLSRMVNPRRPLRGLQVVADLVERSALEVELDALDVGGVR